MRGKRIRNNMNQKHIQQRKKDADGEKHIDKTLGREREKSKNAMYEMLNVLCLPLLLGQQPRCASPVYLARSISRVLIFSNTLFDM